jgi:nucleoid-associated protein YgaU
MPKEADTTADTEDPYKAKEYHVIPGSEIHAPDDKAQKTYTIKSGDNLSDIAQEQLGDANRWKEIYELNKDLIGDNPDLIHPGKTLTLPD